MSDKEKCPECGTVMAGSNINNLPTGSHAGIETWHHAVDGIHCLRNQLATVKEKNKEKSDLLIIAADSVVEIQEENAQLKLNSDTFRDVAKMWQKENERLRGIVEKCANAINEVIFRCGDNWPSEIGYSLEDFKNIDRAALAALTPTEAAKGKYDD